MRKAIFVTGGGSGIGRAVAQYFAGRGWFVGLGDINEAGMAETARLIGPDNASLHLSTCATGRSGARRSPISSSRAAGGSTCCSTMPASAAAARSWRCARKIATW